MEEQGGLEGQHSEERPGLGEAPSEEEGGMLWRAGGFQNLNSSSDPGQGWA